MERAVFDQLPKNRRGFRRKADFLVELRAPAVPALGCLGEFLWHPNRNIDFNIGVRECEFIHLSPNVVGGRFRGFRACGDFCGGRFGGRNGSGFGGGVGLEALLVRGENCFFGGGGAFRLNLLAAIDAGEGDVALCEFGFRGLLLWDNGLAVFADGCGARTERRDGSGHARFLGVFDRAAFGDHAVHDGLGVLLDGR